MDVEVVEKAFNKCCKVHKGRVADRPVVRLELLHGNYHGSRDVRVYIVTHLGVREDYPHYVEAVYLIVISLLRLLELGEEEVEGTIEQYRLF